MSERSSDKESEPEKTESSERVSEESAEEDKKRWGSREVVMDNVTIVNENGVKCSQFGNRENLFVVIEYTAHKEVDDLVVGIAIYRDDQTYIYGTNTLIDYSRSVTLSKHGTVTLKMESLPVNAGRYTLDLAFHRSDGFNYDFWREVATINIKNSKEEAGIISVVHTWEIE